ncbi:MAG: hypothetical protein ACP5N2_00225 [Candidatus Nanoarchaeia archaeon]
MGDLDIYHAKEVANFISEVKNEETRKIAKLNMKNASKIISSAKTLSIDGVISLINSDAFAENLANELKLDECRLNAMTSYNLNQNYFYGLVLSASLTKTELNLHYEYRDVNVFSGKKVSNYFDLITAKTKLAIKKGQEDLPF